MWGDKEKRDKYYPVAYELYGKNILDEEQVSIYSEHNKYLLKWIESQDQEMTIWNCNEKLLIKIHGFYDKILLEKQLLERI